MKLSQITAKLTPISSKAFSTLAVVTLVGAAIAAAAPAAQAQQWAVGVQVGRPGYVVEAPPVEGYYAGYGYRPDRDHEWREHQEWLRQQEWLRRQEWIRHERHEQHEQHERWEHFHSVQDWR